MNDTQALIFTLEKQLGSTLRLGSICLFRDDDPAPVCYSTIEEACEAAKRSGWTLAPLPDEEGVPDGWCDLTPEGLALVKRLMVQS